MKGFAGVHGARNPEQEETEITKIMDKVLLCSLRCLLFITSTTVTGSEYEITGLTRGQQYRVRARAIRAGRPGPWSDQATREPNI
jgi:hypothetical protein